MSKSAATINMNPLLSTLSKLERQHLPYAKSVALNETAFQAKDKLVGVLPQKFDLRSPRTAKGFRVGKANKKQAVQESTVYHLDAWMSIHEFGGTKTAAKGGSMGVPSETVQTKGRTASGKIRPGWWPRNLAKNGGFSDPRVAGSQGGRGHKGKGATKAFLMVSKDGSKTIVRRNKRGGNRYDLDQLYVVRRAVKVAPRWDYFDTVAGVAKKELARNFERALFKSTAFRG